MIDRIEMMVKQIDDYLSSGMDRYESMHLTSDELRFIQKCLTQYQAILINEANHCNDMPNKGVWDIKKGKWND